MVHHGKLREYVGAMLSDSRPGRGDWPGSAAIFQPTGNSSFCRFLRGCFLGCDGSKAGWVLFVVALFRAVIFSELFPSDRERSQSHAT